ncbi:hypothetical protein ES702_01077 [subsurface metagenome]
MYRCPVFLSALQLCPLPAVESSGVDRRIGVSCVRTESASARIHHSDQVTNLPLLNQHSPLPTLLFLPLLNIQSQIPLRLPQPRDPLGHPLPISRLRPKKCRFIPIRLVLSLFSVTLGFRVGRVLVS